MRLPKNLLALFIAIAASSVLLIERPHIPESSSVAISELRLGYSKASVDKLWGAPTKTHKKWRRHYLEFEDGKYVVLTGSPERVVQIYGPEVTIEGFRLRKSDSLKLVEKIGEELNLKMDTDDVFPAVIIRLHGGILRVQRDQADRIRGFMLFQHEQ